MDEAILYVNEVGKRSEKVKSKQAFPTIQREDIMKCILSDYVSKTEKAMLSCMYSEIIEMETKTLKYITEIAISSKQDAEIYDLINILKSKEKMKRNFSREQSSI